MILGPTQAMPTSDDDPYDTTMSSPAVLHKAGTTFALSTYGSSDVRNLPYEIGTAVGFGLPRDAALRAITLHPNHAVRYLSYLNTPGDGMGGNFIFNASATTADDSVDYVRPVDVRSTNPGRWVRTVNP